MRDQSCPRKSEQDSFSTEELWLILVRRPCENEDLAIRSMANDFQRQKFCLVFNGTDCRGCTLNTSRLRSVCTRVLTCRRPPTPVWAFQSQLHTSVLIHANRKRLPVNSCVGVTCVQLGSNDIAGSRSNRVLTQLSQVQAVCPSCLNSTLRVTKQPRITGALPARKPLRHTP